MNKECYGVQDRKAELTLTCERCNAEAVIFTWVKDSKDGKSKLTGRCLYHASRKES